MDRPFIKVLLKLFRTESCFSIIYLLVQLISRSSFFNFFSFSF